MIVFESTWYTFDKADALFPQGGRTLSIFLSCQFGSEWDDFEISACSFTVSTGKDFPCLSRGLKPKITLAFQNIDPLSSTYEITTNTASDTSWNLAVQWLTTCTTNHPKCMKRNKDSRFIPNRLLDVGTYVGNRELHLVYPARSQHQPYVTLSHCWGSSLVVKLTQATRRDLESGFDVSILSKTYRHAVTVAQKLRIRYLWIDSLCILQGSPEDWRSEASMMKDVYGNSFCNIAATGASNGDEGFFVDRDPFLVQSCRVRLDSTAVGPSGDVNQLIESTTQLPSKKSSQDISTRIPTCTIADFHLWEKSVSMAPLNRRGWVVQERLLAPRVLHFGKEQLLWECDELDACETFPSGLPEAYKYPIFRKPSIAGFRNRNPADVDVQKLSLGTMGASGSLNDHELACYWIWDQIVTAYRRCSVSKEEDKLIAVSGLAKEMLQLLHSDDYLAGLWKRNLASGLLWFVGLDGLDSGVKPKRLSAYRAPSWLWAAIDGKGHQNGLDAKSIFIKVLDAHVTPLTEDITGQITNGFIRLQGTLILVGLYVETYSPNAPRMKINENSLDNDCLVLPDVVSDGLDGPYYCLPILIDRQGWMSGLVLQYTGQRRGHYRRYGIFWAHPDIRHNFESPAAESYSRSMWYEDGDKRTIVLV